ncbi:MAG: ABC transporter substrate-binding protein [Planctomycetota bacterium]
MAVTQHHRQIGLAILLGLLHLAGGGTVSAGEMKSVSLQLKWKHQFQFAGYYAAQKQGFFREEGLAVTIHAGGPNIPVAEVVATGKADFGVLGSELILERIQGRPLVLLAVIFQHSARALIVREDSHVLSPTHLADRPFMLNIPESAEFMAMFLKEGVSRNRLLISQKNKTATAKLIAGTVAAINGNIGNQPYTLRQLGTPVRTIRPITYGVDFYGDALFTREDYLSDHPETVAAFRRATLRGWEYAMANVEETIDLIRSTYAPQKSREHLAFEAASTRPLIMPQLVELGHVNPDRIQKIATTYAELGVAPQGFSLKGFLYTPDERATPPWLKPLLGIVGGGLIMALAVAGILFTFNRRLKAMVERQTQELQRTMEQLQQSEKMQAIGQLAGGIAHDFNNQLSGVLGYADMLCNRLEDEKLWRYANGIRKSARRAAELTDQLLAFGRKGKYLSSPVEINRLLVEVTSVLERTLDRNIELLQHLDATRSTTVGDPTQLHNAFLNLALNARDAMPNGGTLLFKTELVKLDADTASQAPYNIDPGEYIKASVSDTGTGISEEVRAHLFEPFFTTKEQGQGTGMGLASVYGTIQNHQGCVTVYSEEGHGSLFSIYLPLHDAKAPAPHPQEALPERGEGHILLVDDEEVVRNMAGDMLRELGYRVTLCSDGEEAVARYRKAWQSIDLVILDMVMPKLDGRAAYLAMRDINPDIRAILSSGYSLNQQAQAILEEGVQAFIQKPFQEAELSKAIREILTS